LFKIVARIVFLAQILKKERLMKAKLRLGLLFVAVANILVSAHVVWATFAASRDFQNTSTPGENSYPGPEYDPGLVPPETGPAFGEGVSLAAPNIRGVSFNSAGSGTGSLHFNIDGITILDRSGGRTQGIEPVYANDPILRAHVALSDLPYLGVAPDGRYHFGGGTFSLIDPAGQFSFTSTFSNYYIRETTSTDPMKNFALMDHVAITDSDLSAGGSPFLRDFVNANFLQIGWSQHIQDTFMGIDFSFHTPTDLVTLTNGFSQSVENVPIGYYVGANMSENPLPEPSSCAMFAMLLFSVSWSRLARHVRSA
jgi:hypothetical protein